MSGTPNFYNGRSCLYFKHSSWKYFQRLCISPVFTTVPSVKIEVTRDMIRSYISSPLFWIIPLFTAAIKPSAPRSVCWPIPKKIDSLLPFEATDLRIIDYIYLKPVNWPINMNWNCKCIFDLCNQFIMWSSDGCEQA